MQHLVAEGTIIAWGSDANYLHTEDGYTHEDFFIASSRAGILKALETLRPLATAGSYTAVTKHKDMFAHTMAHGGKTSSATTGYVRVGSWMAKPGEGDVFAEHVKKHIPPMLDADIADGTVLMYTFDTEDIHTDPLGWYTLAVVYPSAEAIDRAYARLAATMKENLALGEMISNCTVSDAHRDYSVESQLTNTNNRALVHAVSGKGRSPPRKIIRRAILSTLLPRALWASLCPRRRGFFRLDRSNTSSVQFPETIFPGSFSCGARRTARSLQILCRPAAEKSACASP